MSLKKRFEQLDFGKKTRTQPEPAPVETKTFNRSLELGNEVKQHTLKVEMQRISEELEKDIALAEERTSQKQASLVQKKTQQLEKNRKIDKEIEVEMVRARVTSAKSRIRRGIFYVGLSLFFVYLVFRFETLDSASLSVIEVIIGGVISLIVYFNRINRR